ncbi:MAG TPA: Calx-beta domain-containing protein [Verrucomicrobiae bacterium]|nr:Calx-beta domain-containing protein [Verrucomicrobiae bacterium]
MKANPCTQPILLAVIVALACSTVAATAQNQVYSQNFDADDTPNWQVNALLGANMADFFFDYSLAGIPSAPHSLGGTTRGMILQPNMDPLTQAGSVAGYGLSVSPSGFAITENFEMRFDMWLNYPRSGNGSTIVGGAGFGTAGTAPQIASASAGVVDSVFIGATTDGGSAADYRIYTPVSYTSVPDGNAAYVNVTTRNNTQAYYTTNFPAQSVPEAQTNLFPAQTGLVTPAGVQGMKWHDVALTRVANIITYSIDDVPIAAIDFSTNGTLGGQNILFNAFDINGNASTDPLSTNLLFILFDNIRITNFANVVTVRNTPYGTNAEVQITEGSSSPGVFTVTRSSSGAPLTVSYSMSGSADNGIDYTNDLGGTLSGTVTFSATATATNIPVYIVDDTIAEATEIIQMSINPSPDYTGAGIATIQIVDNEPPALAITNVSRQMFERTNDFATFRITRLGSTNVPSFNINLSFAGSATSDTDYFTTNTLTFEPGIQSTNFSIFPIEDGLYEGNETATVTIGSSPDYAVSASGSASVTLVDSDGPPETVLFADDFNADTSANWSLFHAANNDVPDYTAIFGFDYSGQNIVPSPHGGGDTLGLFLTVNKDQDASAAALNLYPVGQSFSGNFALKFDMILNMVSGGSSTEFALFGINHSGTKTNWWRSGGVPAGWTFDGIFYAVETDGQSAPSYANYSSPTTAGNNPTALTAGANVSAFSGVFKSPPWAVAGSPAVNATSNNAVWADVELSKVGDVITLRINKSVILSYTNATPYTSGNIMLGYEDAFDSMGTIQNYVIYDNLRVISLASPVITSIQRVGGNAVVQFTANAADQAGQFVVQAASSVAGPYEDLGATITSPSAGTFSSSIAINPGDGAKFYRVRRAY